MTDKTGGPAFPRDAALETKGMSLRDYFAIHVDSAEVDRYCTGNEFRPVSISRHQARYAIADAMLAERAK